MSKQSTEVERLIASTPARMTIQQLMQAVLQASPAKRRELERVILGDDARDKDEMRLVSISEFARILNIGRNTAYRIVDTGRVDTVELNGSRKITMRSINQFLRGERPANEKTDELIAESKIRYAIQKAKSAK
jgi:hypothetical protein